MNKLAWVITLWSIILYIGLYFLHSDLVELIKEVRKLQK